MPLRLCQELFKPHNRGRLLQRAERASKAADEALRAAQAERERSQKLLEEAQSLSARAAEAEARCADSVRRVEGVEAARKKRLKHRLKSERQNRQ